MKTTSPTLRRAALGAVALLTVVGALVAARADASLPQTETQMLEHAVNDKYYGDVLAVTQDTIYSATFSLRGVSVNSNNVLSVTAKRATQGAALGHSVVLNASAGFPSGALYFYLSGTSHCAGVTATAATTLAVSSNGGFVPTVTGKAGLLLLNSAGTTNLSIMHAPSFTAYPCVVLPSGRIAAGSAITF